MNGKKGIAIYTNDGVSSLLILPRLLEFTDYEVISVNPWWHPQPELLQKAIEVRPNIIVIDDASFESLDACQKLKANQLTKDIPIVFVTWRNKTQIISSEEATASGVDFLGDKNVTIEELVAVLKSYIS